MHEMYDLRDKLCDELKDTAKKGISASSIGTIDTLAHAIKNIDKIIEVDEMGGGDYSGRAYPDAYGVSYRGGSYARGRINAPRDSMGRYSGRGYSRSGDLADRLHDLMRDAPNDQIRDEIQRLADKL